MIMFHLLTVLISLPAFLSAAPFTEEHEAPTCGYQACPRTEPHLLNVHLVPHSHDDVGWLKTVDQYYYGSKTYIQRAGVQYILNSVVNELWNNPERRFVQVETAFLWKWWQDLTEKRKKLVRMLVEQGRLEIIGGGWSMNDEAAAHYQSIIDQFTWGFRRLDEMLGNCSRPRIGWQIDPFGHSREMASIFSQLGFDGLFFARLHYEEKQNRLDTKTAEFIWAGSPKNLGDSASIFTSILYNHYSAPPGFCFDVLCNDEPIIDDQRSGDYNVHRKVDDFIQFCEEQNTFYRTNNIIITMGDDFNYQDATMNYKNMDKLIKYVNARQSSGSQVNVFYSTPSCYVKAVNEANLTWTVKKDDFFPYASGEHSYWTGYFTSRPTSKYFERQGNNYLQVCKQLAALTGLDDTPLEYLREAMGVMQHHDAITGTEKQKVANDYGLILHRGIQECERVIEEAVSKLATPHPQMTVASIELDSCLQLNVSQCTVSERSGTFLVTVYNPLSHPVSHYVRLPVLGNSYTVLDPTGTELEVQMMPVHPAVQTLLERTTRAVKEIVFRAKDLPPLGFRSYYVTRDRDRKPEEILREDKIDGNVIVGNEKLGVELDGITGMMVAVIRDGIRVSVNQDFLYYTATPGHNFGETHRASGAYVLRPKEHGPVRIRDDSDIISTIYKGPLVDEIHQQFSSWVSQVIRVYKEEEHVELEWMVGPIPTSDNEGKEVISRFSTDLSTHGVFYTDSNGREMMKRHRNDSKHHPEPVAGNYYPVTSKIVLKDKKAGLELAVLNDRAQGGSSLQDGEVELMVHRRLLYDDSFGVGEALDETAFGRGLTARGRHWLVLGSAAQHRELALQKLLSPRLFLTTVHVNSFEEWRNKYNMEYSGLREALPKNVHILTLEPWKDGTVLLRLEHFLETGEDPVLSQPATVNLENMFVPFSLASVEETALGANQPLSEMHRLSWKAIEYGNVSTVPSRPSTLGSGLTVTLTPMQIRTFIVRVKW